jgi:signal transduction histidine kinase
MVGGELLGVLSVLSQGRMNWEHLDLLVAISGQVGLALSNARKYRQVERRVAELSALQQVATLVNSRLEMAPLLKEVVDQVHEVLGYEIVEIFLVEGEELVLEASSDAQEGERPAIPLERGIIGRAARTNRAAFVPDVDRDSDYHPGFENTNSEIVVPLHKGDIVVGVLNVESSAKGGLNRDDLQLLTLLGDQVSVAIENAYLYDQLRKHTTDLEQTVADRTAALEDALEQARQADRLKTQFVADVSHELRTPLTNIRLYLELLNYGNPDRQQDYMDTLNRETDRLVTLIEDLLAISRLDAGTAMPELAELNLNDLAQPLVRDRARMLAEKRLDLTFEPEEDLPTVRADERMLSQVLANLVTNAMNYTPGGGQIRIQTQSRQEEGQRWVTLSVHDTGIGIPEKEQGRVFERFFRGAASRDLGIPGTGLGLAICKEILDRHEGRITMRSTPREGSTFTIWLPPSGEASGEPGE